MSVSFPRLLLCSSPRPGLICFHRDFYQKDTRATAITTAAKKQKFLPQLLVDCITLKQRKNKGRSSERYIDNFLFIPIHFGGDEYRSVVVSRLRLTELLVRNGESRSVQHG